MASTLAAHASRAITAIRSNPYAFNSVTGFSLFTGSDALAQKLETESTHQLLMQKNDENAIAQKKNDTSEIDDGDENFSTTSINTSIHAADMRSSGAMATSSTKIFDLTTLDSRRLLSAGAIGVLFGGFVYPLAYAKLDALWKGVTIVTTLKKSILEIATVGIFVNSISISTRGLLVGKDTEKVVEHTLQEMPSVTVNDARVWLPYNIVAFSVIPIYIRPATTSLMEACWQTYISLCSHNYKAEDVEEDPSSVVATNR